MTTLIRNSFETGTDGQDLAPGNTGGALSTAITSVPKNAGVTVRFSNEVAHVGGLSMRIGWVPGGAGYAHWAIDSSARIVCRFYMLIPSGQVIDGKAFCEIRSSAGRIVDLGFHADGRVIMTHTFGQELDAAFIPPRDQWIRYEVAVTPTQTIEFGAWDDAGNKIASGGATGAAVPNIPTVSIVRLGTSGGPDSARVIFYDDVEVCEQVSGWIGAAGATETAVALKGWAYTDHGTESGPNDAVNRLIGATVGSTCEVGDWVLAVYTGTSSYQVAAVDSGWRQLVWDPPGGLGTATSAGTLRLAVFARERLAGDSDRYLFEVSTGAITSSLMLVWGSGAAPTADWIVGALAKRSEGAASAVTTEAPPLMMPGKGLVLHVHSERTSAAEASYTSMAGATAYAYGGQYDAQMIQTIALGFEELAAAGSSTQSVVTWPNSQSNNGIGVQIGLPFAEPGGPVLGAAAMFWTGAAHVPGRVTVLMPDGVEVTAGRIEHVFGTGTVAELLARDPFYIAHRCGGLNWPELTLRAARNATLLGMRALEVSVWRTLDGVFVASHDESLARVTGDSRLIRSVNWADIAALKVQASTTDNPAQPDQPLARLDELLAIYGGKVTIFMDDKSGQNTAAILDLMDAHGGPDYFVHKEYRGGDRAAQYQARGYKVWGFFYESDGESVFAAEIPKYDLLGMQWDASQATWDRFTGTGKPVIAHIVATNSARLAAIGKGAAGLMTTAPIQAYPLGG